MLSERIKEEIKKIDKEIHESRQFSLFIDKSIENHDKMKAEIKEGLGLSITTEPFTDIRIFIGADMSFRLETVNSPIYIYGIYTKNCRNLSQTKMFLKKYVNLKSVDGFISDLKVFFDAEKVNFIGAGREDIDVKMIKGRPFLIEVTRPRQNLHFDHLDLVLNEGVSIRNLLNVTRAVKKELCEEESACKTYRALVYCHEPLNPEVIEEYRTEFNIQQKTPIRVLHRRSNLTRTRHMQIMNWQVCGEYSIVNIRAQGGSYIKEFINGDFGRTVPSLTGLFHSYCDYLLLDVLEVEIKEISTSNIINYITTKITFANQESEVTAID